MANKFDRRKVLYLVMSVVVACAIWFYVDETNTSYPTQEFRDVPIEYLNEDTVLADRGYMLVEDGTDTTIDITLEGPRRLLAQVSRSNIRVTADLSNVTAPGVQTVRYTVTFPGTMLNGRRFTLSSDNVKEASLTAATVNIQELNRKEIPIKCEIVGNVADGYTAGELQMSQTTMEIRGQAEAIDPVAYAKVVLNLDDAESTVTQELPIQYYDADDQLLESTGIRSTDGDTIQVTLPVTVVKELRLTLDLIQSPGASRNNVDCQIVPETITVSGDAALLNDMESIVLDEFDLLTLNGTGTYIYPITVPEGCENLSGVTRATVTLSFRDMVREERTTTNFIFRNLPEGKRCSILTEELTVSIFGTSPDVAAVTGEDIQVVADLSDFGSANGSYTVPAEIQVQTGGDIGVAGTYQVRVVISELEDEGPPAEAPSEETDQGTPVE